MSVLRGGSYTRDPATGALVPNDPPAPPATPAPAPPPPAPPPAERPAPPKSKSQE